MLGLLLFIVYCLPITHQISFTGSNIGKKFDQGRCNKYYFSPEISRLFEKDQMKGVKGKEDFDWGIKTSRTSTLHRKSMGSVCPVFFSLGIWDLPAGRSVVKKIIRN
jgi:hypothetical protein